MAYLQLLYNISIYNKSDLGLDITNCVGLSKTKYFEDWICFLIQVEKSWGRYCVEPAGKS
jgi:hypothetical protein